MSTIKNRLKALRTQREITQDELVSELNSKLNDGEKTVSKMTVSNWENNKHAIKTDKAQKLAEFFGVSVGYLLGYTDNSKKYEDEIVLESEEGKIFIHSQQRNKDQLAPIRLKAQKEKNDFIDYLAEHGFFLDNRTIESLLIFIKNMSMDSSDPQRLKLSEMVVNDTLPDDIKEKYSFLIDKGIY